ncbi:thyroid transcription factor 1-associated protein 26 homolog isoform X2 [Syngnathus acus]|uniref:thyroid transcription factor 1-associated protein 26 homolog isoform X2 n=1 Tax=Syngnathus acus TaxID=161584 RepID=UPI001885E199|nr:thyroid transcription factor 1-associated protein 26 homolog isoform X2 [Syngnathus acus]
MAPTNTKMKTGYVPRKEGNWRKPQNAGVRKKKWIPEDKVFQGSIQEGQGFAFDRKEKVKHNYNKILRKERKKPNTQTSSSAMYYDQYPEHLKHLYMAEAEKLKNEMRTNRMNRVKMRNAKSQEKPNEESMEEKAGSDPEGTDAPKGESTEKSASVAESTEKSTSVAESTDKSASVAESTEKSESVAESTEKSASVAESTKKSASVAESTEKSASVAESTEKSTSVAERLPLSNRMKKKLGKKTSYQRSLEVCQSIRDEQRKKKEDFLKRKQQREDAIQKYKEKKMETYQMLCKKTKKGQPNLNIQMDYLLQKIQKIAETTPKT